MVLNYNSSICMECNEAIFNPVCPQCLARQVSYWAKASGKDKAVKGNIARFTESLKEDFYSEGVKCIVCKDNETSICPYCFTEEIYTFIVKSGAGREILEEFMTHFNYDFEHEGYGKDFEENY